MATPEEKNNEFIQTEDLIAIDEVTEEEDVFEEPDDGVLEIDDSDDAGEEFFESDSEDEEDLGDTPEEDM
jgi:hypothetical protein